mmetsp:Transcript_351/g.808  ORF Transcript_351/g.808 Transcript_351/m.808 type:complete len:82 (+) Transcript_351:1509-1754(+)
MTQSLLGLRRGQRDMEKLSAGTPSYSGTCQSEDQTSSRAMGKQRMDQCGALHRHCHLCTQSPGYLQCHLETMDLLDDNRNF